MTRILQAEVGNRAVLVCVRLTPNSRRPAASGSALAATKRVNVVRFAKRQSEVIGIAVARIDPGHIGWMVTDGTIRLKVSNPNKIRTVTGVAQ